MVRFSALPDSIIISVSIMIPLCRFLWIMGVCIPIAVKSQVKRGIPRLQIFKNILIRSLKLIGLGVLYNSLSGPVVLFGENANLRIPGVLHRFGICYFICSTLVLFSMTVNFRKPEGKGVSTKFYNYSPNHWTEFCMRGICRENSRRPFKTFPSYGCPGYRFC